MENPTPDQYKSILKALRNDRLLPNNLLFDKAAQNQLPLFDSTHLKTDWEGFKELLQQYNITCLYHFTDGANLRSIMERGGLYSWLYCVNNNITVQKPGGNDDSRRIDERKNLHNYVRLSFIREHPMMHVVKKANRISEPVILSIDPRIIFLKPTKFTTQNAAKNGVFAKGDLDTFKQIKFELFRKRYFDLNEEEKSYYQAEVLALEHVSVESIVDIKPFR